MFITCSIPSYSSTYKSGELGLSHFLNERPEIYTSCDYRSMMTLKDNISHWYINCLKYEKEKEKKSSDATHNDHT